MIESAQSPLSKSWALLTVMVLTLWLTLAVSTAVNHTFDIPLDSGVSLDTKFLHPQNLAIEEMEGLTEKQCSDSPKSGGSFTGCTFKSRADNMQNVKLKCTRCTWDSYSVSVTAGCLHMYNNVQVQLFDCTFQSVTANGYAGGTITLYSGLANLLQAKNCTWTSCKSTINGGCIFMYQGTSEMEDCTFTKCAATQYSGGAIGKDSSSACLSNITAVNCICTECQAGYDGAFVCSSTGNVYVESCIVEKCSSGLSGGALFQTERSESMTVINCTFKECKARDNRNYYGGGALRLCSGFANISDCLVDGCTTTADGGAIVCSEDNSGSIYLRNTEIRNCQCSLLGGGILFNSLSGTIELDCVRIDGCKSTSKSTGHAIHIISTPSHAFDRLCILNCGDNPLSLPFTDPDLKTDECTACNVISTSAFTAFVSSYSSRATVLQIVKLARVTYMIDY